MSIGGPHEVLPSHDYERFGFLVTAELTLPNGIPLWGMTRQPSLGLGA